MPVFAYLLLYQVQQFLRPFGIASSQQLDRLRSESLETSLPAVCSELIGNRQGDVTFRLGRRKRDTENSCILSLVRCLGRAEIGQGLLDRSISTSTALECFRVEIGQLDVKLTQGILQFGQQELRFCNRPRIHLKPLSLEAGVKVMTFNIWNYTRPWKERRELIARLIEQHQPEAVALQETRHDFRYERGKGQGEQLADLTGYHSTVAVGQVYIPVLRIDEAVTILTHETPRVAHRRELSRLRLERDDENQRVCVGVELRWQDRAVFVFNTHFSLSARARLQNASEVTSFVREVSGDNVAVLMGDLNAEPGADAIRLLNGAYEHDGERGDFVDCWPAAHPGDPGFTYASFDPVRRIDYVFARNVPATGIAARIVGGESSNGVYASDHLGLLVNLPLEGLKSEAVVR